jgi:hypothetical protein
MKNIKQEIFHKASIWANALLASDFSRKFDKWFGSLSQTKATEYDKAIDIAYNSPNAEGIIHEGGIWHRLTDMLHDPVSMWKAVKDTKIDDTRKEEINAFIDSFFKDFNTTQGLPFVSITKETFDNGALFLSKNFSIPKNWFYDIQTLNGSELMAGSLSVVSLVFSWNKKDAKLFGDLISSLMLAGAIGGNPITIFVAIIALAKHFNSTKNSKKISKKFLEGTKIGSLSIFSFLGISSFVGGPVWIGLILGLIVAVLVRKHSSKFNIKETYEWFRDSMKSLLSSAYNTLV